MTTAAEKLANQRNLPGSTPDARGDRGVDLDNFMVDAVNRLNIDFDLADRITDGSIERTMDGASTLTVTVDDTDRVLLNSSIWDYTLEVELDGMWFRLVNVSKTGDDLELNFEDRVVAWLREHNSPLKASRGKMTRAEFIQKMVAEVKADNKAKEPIHLYSPELHKTQSIATPDDKKPEAKRRAQREGGLSTAADLKAKGHAMTGEQIKTAERILDVGVAKNANRKCLVASMMVAIDEPTTPFLNDTGGDRDSVGVFQQRASQGWPASRNIEKDAGAFFDAVIKTDKANPTLSLHMLCQTVQRSGTPDGSNYEKYTDEGKKIVEEYGGGSSGSTTRNYYKSYQFTRGAPGGPKGENTWQAGGRLAEEVRWRFFVVGNWVYYVADRDLIRSKPVMTIDEDSKGIESIDFDFDTGKRSNEATITCEAGRWFADPGEVVKLKDTMGPAKGRWLVSRITRPLFDEKTTITIKQPQDPKKEPAPVLTSSTSGGGVIVSGSKISGNSLREKIVNAAEAAISSKYHYHYLQRRPMSNSLYSKRAQQGIDCSEFVTLCYKAAGVVDPNGFGYNGSGNTQTLMANGKKTGSPSPGDLIFYRSPEHVGVYIGDGQVIEMGGDPGPRKLNVNYRDDALGYWTFHLDPLRPETYKGSIPGQKHGGEAGA